MLSKDRAFVLKEIQAVIFIENSKVPQDHHALCCEDVLGRTLQGKKTLPSCPSVGALSHQ
jgi:hypothetical protein